MTAETAAPTLAVLRQSPALHRQSPALSRDIHAEHPALFLLPDTRNGGPRGPHPGDVLYWVACVGGACLLLLAATS